jgi:hypothetical protein
VPAWMCTVGTGIAVVAIYLSIEIAFLRNALWFIRIANEVGQLAVLARLTSDMSDTKEIFFAGDVRLPLTVSFNEASRLPLNRLSRRED